MNVFFFLVSSFEEIKEIPALPKDRRIPRSLFFKIDPLGALNANFEDRNKSPEIMFVQGDPLLVETRDVDPRKIKVK